MAEKRFDAVVIGAGPGGYPTAIRLGQLKVKAAVIEREYMGGVCLNVGCIPSKAVIHAAKMFDKMGHADELGIGITGKPTLDVAKMQAWKGTVVSKLTGGVKQLVKGNGSEIIEGSGKLLAPGPDGHRVEVTGKDGKQTIEAKNLVVATGSTPIEIPGFPFDGKRVWSSTHALAPKQLPKRIIVIGGGYIGLELGLVYHKLGTEIRVLEFMDRVLPGMEDGLRQQGDGPLAQEEEASTCT
jgi:dihydrolipoamide dehydrogenase